MRDSLSPPKLQNGLSLAPASDLRLPAADPGGHTEYGCKFLPRSSPRRYLQHRQVTCEFTATSDAKTDHRSFQHIVLTKPSLGVVLDEFAFIDCSDPQLALDGSDQWRPLEQSAGQRLQCLQTNHGERSRDRIPERWIPMHDPLA